MPAKTPIYSADPAALDDYNFNNAYEALTITSNARKKEDGSWAGPYGHEVQVRLGHGRYGLQPPTLRLMQETGAVSELCLTSNILLNHADSHQGPFNLYAEYGVSYVLGSDGAGLYSTTMPNEFSRAVQGGMNPASRQKLEETEAAIIAADERRFIEKAKQWRGYEAECAATGVDPFKALEMPVFTTPDGKQRWTPEITARRAEEKAAKHDAWMSSLSDMGVNTDPTDAEALLASRQLHMFSGASKSSWKNIPTDQQALITEEMRKYVSRLDVRRDVVMTGGTDYGFEAVIHRLIEERNKTLLEGERIPVIGAFTLEANAKEVRPGTLSHAIVLKYGDQDATSWMDQSPALMDMAERTKAKIITAGGGQVVRDMILDADGRGLIKKGQMFLFAGIKGASGEKAAEYPYAQFRSAEELIALMNASKKPQAQSVGMTAYLGA